MTSLSMYKYIFEIRYEAVIQAFDRRGLILEKVWKPFMAKMPHWNVENVGVTITDKQSKPTRTFHIGHMRTYIAYENPTSELEFIDDAKRFIGYVFTALPEINKIVRAGYRIVYFKGDERDISVYNKVVKDRWARNDFPISIPVTDIAVVLEHNNGRIAVSAIKPQDGIFQQVFPSSEIKFDNSINGISIDVDSYIRDIEISKKTPFTGILTAVQTATLATVGEIIKTTEV